MKSREEPRNPKFLTSSLYKKVFDDRERMQGELEEFRDLRQFLGLAREIRREATTYLDSEAGDAQAIDLATTQALDREKARLIGERAAKLRVELTEEQRQRLQAEFEAEHAARVHDEVAAEVADRKETHRKKVAAETEAQLRQLKTEELLERIGTDEAQATLERLGKSAVVEANRQAMIAELQQAAKLTHGLELSLLPKGSVFTLGLDADEVKPRERINPPEAVAKTDRHLRMRVLEPYQGVLELLDDSWMSATDPVRKGNALQDSTMLRMPVDDTGLRAPRLSVGVEPAFLLPDTSALNLYGLEAQILVIDDARIF